VLAFFVEIKVPAHATDADNERGEKKYESGYFQILVLRVAIDNAYGNDGITECDGAYEQEPSSRQKEGWFTEKIAPIKTHISQRVSSR